MPRLPAQIRSELGAFGSGRRKARLVADLARLALLVIGAAVVLFLADYFANLSPMARLTLLALGLAWVTASGVRLLWRLLRRESLTALAVEFERRSGAPFRSSLVTAVELNSSSDVERFGYSRELVDACTSSAAKLAAEAVGSRLVDWTEARAGAKRAAVAFLVGLGVASWGHDALAYIGARYWAAAGGRASTGPATFLVTPGDVRVVEGSDLTVRLALSGTERFPRLLLTGLAPEPARPVELRHDGRAYVATLSALTESFDYRFEAGPFVSRSYRVTVVRPPAVRSLVLRHHYPAYTGLGDETQEKGSYDVVALVGTRVTAAVESTRPLTSAALILDGRTRLPAKLTGNAGFTQSFEVKRSGTYSVELIGPEGFPNHAVSYHITALEDRVPLVYILEPGRDLALPVAEVTSFPMQVFASDDFGVATVKLHYTLTQRFDYTFLTSDFEEALDLSQAEPRKMTLRHLWDLRKRVFQPGDVITYFVEAVDKMPGAKPHAGRSKTYTIRIPFITDTAAEVSTEQEEQISSVEELARKQKEVDEKLAAAMKDLQRQEGQVDWKTRQQLETLSKRQQVLKKRAEEVSSRMASTLDKLQKNDLIDAGTLEKLKEVQDLFNQVADSRMKQLMEQLRQLMSQTKLEPQDLGQIQKNLDKQRYGKELDRVLASLKKLKAQQEMQRAVKAAEELAKKQDALRKETEQRLKDGKPVQDLASKQEELERATEKLLSQLDKTAKEAEKPFPDAAKALSEAAQKARKEKLPENVAQARKELSSGRPEQALDQQNQALNKMRALQDSLLQTQSGMKKKQISVNLAKLLALVRFGLDASQLQETLATVSIPEEGFGDNREYSRSLARTQGRVLRGLESFERGFESLISDEAIFKSAFVSAVSELLDSAQEAATAFEATHVHSGKQLAGRSLEKLNRVLAKLLEMVQQLLNQQQGAGMEGFFEQLEKLIEQQQSINDRAERLKQEPSTNPLLSQLMQRMAAEQAMVREALEQLAKKYQQAQQVVGDLDSVAQEMREVEEALKKFDTSDQTRQKQKRILYRMLEAEKSLHKQGESKKRVARFAKDYSPTQVDPVQQELTEVRQKLFHNLQRESYPVEDRDLVERYYQSIGQ